MAPRLTLDFARFGMSVGRCRARRGRSPDRNAVGTGHGERLDKKILGKDPSPRDDYLFSWPAYTGGRNRRQPVGLSLSRAAWWYTGRYLGNGVDVVEVPIRHDPRTKEQGKKTGLSDWFTGVHASKRFGRNV